MKTILRGALAGIVATAVMTGVMFLGKLLGLLHLLPPEEITEHAEEEAGTQPQSQPAFDASWLAAHVGYGAASGIVYLAARRLLPGHRVVPGLLYGGLLWAVGYLGLLPALGLYPWPDEDNPSRTAVMIVAHAVYGVAVAEVAPELRSVRSRR